MRDTRLSLPRFLAEHDRAAGYFPGDDGRIRISPRDTNTIASAAAIYSNLHDMPRWLRILLDSGKIDGRRVVRASSITDILTPWISVPNDGGYSELGPTTYGMGFYLTSYRGRQLAHHLRCDRRLRCVALVHAPAQFRNYLADQPIRSQSGAGYSKLCGLRPLTGA